MNAASPAVYLRPHHLLCIQKFTGHGYDAAFTAHMTALCERLRQEPETPVVLVSGADDLCAACPHCIGGICDAKEKTDALDRDVLEALTLPETPQPWTILAENARNIIRNTNTFDSICGCCQWFELCKITGGTYDGTKKASNPYT